MAFDGTVEGLQVAYNIGENGGGALLAAGDLLQRPLVGLLVRIGTSARTQFRALERTGLIHAKHLK